MPSRGPGRFTGPYTPCVLLAIAAASPAARAGKRVDLSFGWPAQWRLVGSDEAATIGGLGTASIVLQLFLNAPDLPRWDSAILFDDGARNALRASSSDGRSRAAAFSNAAYALVAVPLVVDAGRSKHTPAAPTLPRATS